MIENIQNTLQKKLEVQGKKSCIEEYLLDEEMAENLKKEKLKKKRMR